VSKPLDRYLTQSYRREVLGESVTVEMPSPEDKLIMEIEQEIARIDALQLGAHLASRDFAAYQNRRALSRLLIQMRTARLEAQKKQEQRQKERQEDAAD
jgi:hypothetical protein